MTEDEHVLLIRLFEEIEARLMRVEIELAELKTQLANHRHGYVPPPVYGGR